MDKGGGTTTLHAIGTASSPVAAAALFPEIDQLLDDLQRMSRGLWGPSSVNLAHYLAFRAKDRRPLQHALASLGLSSLGRCECAVLANVAAVARALDALCARPPRPMPETPAPPSLAAGEELIRARTETLLGPEPPSRRVRIMVTAPSEAADDPALVAALVDAGMDVLRINCAHDDPTRWARMADHARAAARAKGRSVRVMMDIAGPKARTGEMEPGPAVVRWNPERNELGRVIRPSRVALAVPGIVEETDADAIIPLPPEFVASLRAGQIVEFHDLRGKHRTLVIDSTIDGAAFGLTSDAAWIGHETLLRAPDSRACPVGIPRIPQTITLRPGDTLLLTADPTPGRPAPLDARGMAIGPARIPFSLPELFLSARAGHRVLLDDGKVEASVARADPLELELRITHARGGAVRLGPDKGVNFPDAPADHALRSLTRKDLADLDCVARCADLVGYSFVRSPGDIADLVRALAERDALHLGVVLKIETAAGFENLPALLLAAIEPATTQPAPRGGIGVMIARGDLAVECGWERMAEVQEEILWLCEAAHIPVVWATQVLESLAKRGLPSRSEITDAAMSVRAECVMLNKGPYVARAVATLDDVLRRMAAHQSKKRAMLRPLRVAERFIAAHSPTPAR